MHPQRGSRTSTASNGVDLRHQVISLAVSGLAKPDLESRVRILARICSVHQPNARHVTKVRRFLSPATPPAAHNTQQHILVRSPAAAAARHWKQENNRASTAIVRIFPTGLDAAAEPTVARHSQSPRTAGDQLQRVWRPGHGDLMGDDGLYDCEERTHAVESPQRPVLVNAVFGGELLIQRPGLTERLLQDAAKSGFLLTRDLAAIYEQRVS